MNINLHDTRRKENTVTIEPSKGNGPSKLMIDYVVDLSDQDMADLAAYFSTQTHKSGLADEATRAVGERLYRAGNSQTRHLAQRKRAIYRFPCQPDVCANTRRSDERALDQPGRPLAYHHGPLDVIRR